MYPKNKTSISFWRIFLFNRIRSSFGMVVITLLIQQLIVASSSVWLTRFAKNLQLGNFDKLYLALFSMSLLLPYLPAMISLKALKNWEIFAINRFWEKHLEIWKNRVDLWADKNRQNVQISVITNEGPALISETTRYIYDLISASLNAFLNLIVISSLFDFKLFLSFVAGGFFLIIGTFLTKTFNENAAAKFEKEKIHLNHWLHNVWDNVTIGNELNFQKWNTFFEKKKAGWKQSKLGYCFTQEVMSTLISMLAFIPTVLVIVAYSYDKANHPQDLVPFVVLFPRIFILLNIITSLVFLFRGFYGYRGRWIYLLDQVKPPSHAELLKRINMHDINVDQCKSSFATPQEFMQFCQAQSQRLTLRGNNGAGKSTLLYWLKTELGSACFYLPTQNNLTFALDSKSLSTGQKMKAQLTSVLENTQASFILLDEWDANMDRQSIEEFSAIIDKISHSKTIIEIRHR